MAQLQNTFDASKYENVTEFSIVPPGEYIAFIESDEVKTSKSSNVDYLNQKFKIIEGDYKNRYIWNVINFRHPDENVKSIAMRTLATISRAVHKEQINDTSELHHRSMIIKVAVKKQQGFDDKNVINNYKKINEGPDVIAQSDIPSFLQNDSKVPF